MEGEEGPDPLELSKNPKVIKDAQEEIGKVDVLVCGDCHEVFHFIEPFQEHRQKEKCTKISMVRENYKHEPKAQVWAFMLWKNSQLKKTKTKEGENAPTSWMIYQSWCKLGTEEKDAWVAAGQTIQSFTRISAAKVQEIRTKTQTPVIKGKIPKSAAQDAAKNNDNDSLEEGEIHGDGSDMDSKGTKKTNDVLKKTPFKPVQLNSDVTIGLKKLPDLKKALRTGKNESTEEAVVERILSRKYNHKKKSMEYLIKWESLNESENTWEPKQHLEKCKTLVEDFDKIFNRPKSGPKLTTKRVEESHSEHSEAEEMTPGRPQRTSKQKAVNQVKAWCGDITEGDEGSGKRKSFSDDDDSTDSFEKKIKLEEDSDSSEEEKPSVTIRRVVKAQNPVNGVTKKPETSFASSTPQRVVRVSQKQLPSLSSGVYIMSKTEGIIKLDSNTPPLGTPLLRVGPKIGQTHIKMIKKETGSPNIVRTPVKTVPKLIKTSESKPLATSKTLTKVSTPRRPPVTPVPKPPIRIIESNTGEQIEKVDSKKLQFEDEDSDGLEELAFPMDLPLPSPDSPPGEFTLCPLTGKILGQTDEEPMEQEDSITENTSLDILVKQAVAELPDVDMDAGTSGVKDDTGAKTNEEVTEAPVISISAVPEDSINVQSVDSVNVSSIVTISTVAERPSSTSSVASIITTAPVGSGNTPVPTFNVIAATTTTAAPTISTSAAPAPVINAIPKIGLPAAAIASNSKIATKDDIEERLTPNTIEKTITPKLALTTVPRPRPSAAGTSILNAALTNKVPQPLNRVGPQKKLLSTTPHTIRQKGTPVNRTPISRPAVPRPSPSTTIIHKLAPNRNRPVAPRTVPHQEPVLKRASNVTTYKPANIARRIGNTTIYKTSEKPPTSSIKTTSAPIVSHAPAAQPALIPATQTVINMPLLTPDEEVAAPTNPEPLNEVESLPTETSLADLSTFSLPESETPLLITGDDGTIYQVAGQNEDGQTILISEGPDGQQQCVLVSSETSNEEVPGLMMDTPAAESEELEQTLMVSVPSEEVETEGDGDGEESQVVAQIIKADPPSPGGTRKVVLMLPDGNLMMTDVTAEQYAALELDK